MKRVCRLSGQYWSALGTAKLHAALAVLFATTAACAEALGLVSLVPVLANSDPAPSELLPKLLGVAVFLIAAAGVRHLADIFTSRVTTSVEAQMRSELAEAIVYAKWPGVARMSQGELTSAIMSGATAVSNGAAGFVQAITNGMVVVVLLVAACVLAPPMLGAAALFMTVVGVLMRARMAVVRRNERSLAKATDDVNEGLSSSLGDIKYIRLSASDDAWHAQAQTKITELAQFRYRQLALPIGTRTLIEVVSAVFLTVIIGIGLIVLGDPARSVVFVAMFARIAPKLQAFQHFATVAVGGATWIDAWRERSGRLGDIAAPPYVSSTQKTLVLPRIEFKSVEFSYDDNTRVLSKFDLTINPGDRIAIVGASGSGKSTLVDLMLGLLQSTSGQVLLDGREPSGQEWWEFRRSVGIVPQDVPIRRGTLIHNVCWDSPIDLPRFWAALEAASIADYVKSLPEGFDTVLTSRLHGLSGGQRQRLGIARALYREPALLILDEATSALDDETERQFLKTMDGLPSGMTVVAVSHRPAVLKHVTRVVRVENGCVMSEPRTKNA